MEHNKIKFDQHFLEDEEILNKEVEIITEKKPNKIVEVGSGDGRLTKKLIDSNKDSKIISIEKDEEFKDQLKKFEQYANYKYFIGDVLDILNDINTDSLIGNIPYSITETLYYKVMEKEINHVVFIHGKKFEKVLENNSKLSYFVNSIYDKKIIENIEGNKFNPPAKTKSILIELNIKEKMSPKEKFFYNIFKKREKKFYNCLLFSIVDTFRISKNDAKKFLTDNLDIEIPDKCIDNLSNKEFINVIDLILSEINKRFL